MKQKLEITERNHSGGSFVTSEKLLKWHHLGFSVLTTYFYWEICVKLGALNLKDAVGLTKDNIELQRK